MSDVEQVLQMVVEKQLGKAVAITAIAERADGTQGMSGNEIHYFDVSFALADVRGETVIVTKPMPLHERRALLRLGEQGDSVPVSACTDMTSDSALVAMQHLAQQVSAETHAQQIADSLASIHIANLGKQTELSWLPKADDSYIRGWIINDCWRVCWESLMEGGEYIDGYGNRHGVAKPGGNFSAEFARYTPLLEAAAERFADQMSTLWRDANTLTLINGDLHSYHTMSDGDRVKIIDWGQSRYGSLYLDLPNIFSDATVHHYRNALAVKGFDIPVTQFRANFEAVRAFVGFKYMGVGLWNWCFGDRPHVAQNVRQFMGYILGDSAAS